MTVTIFVVVVLVVLAGVVVGLLWIFVALCIVAFWPVDQLAALLFVPYLVWVSIAAALNAGVWQLNPDEASNPPEIAT